MKQKFKRLMAVLFAIVMISGVIPFNGKKVEAATTYDSTIFYINEFGGKRRALIDDVNQFVHAQFGASAKTNTQLCNICEDDLVFTNSWNHMSYKQTVVVINTHGDPTSVCGMDASDIKKLQFKQIDYIVLLGCNAGHYDWRSDNIARAFAEKFHCTVIACDGAVASYLSSDNHTYWPQPYASWKDGCAKKGSTRKNVYGWLAYVPKSSANNYQGKLYQIGKKGSGMSVYEMLMKYSSGNKTSLPVS